MIDNLIVVMAALMPPSIYNKDTTSFINIYRGRAAMERCMGVHYWLCNGQFVIDIFVFGVSSSIAIRGGNELNKIATALAEVEDHI